MENPFLPSQANELPKLKQVSYPVSAVAELEQAMNRELVRVPLMCNRHGSKPRRCFVPTSKSAISFRQTYMAFCSARRPLYAENAEQADLMIASEEVELVHAAKQVTPPHGSLPPRSLVVSLVIPRAFSTNCPDALAFLDAFAAMTDAVGDDGGPVCSQARFGIYTTLADHVVQRCLLKQAKASDQLDAMGLMVRWCDPARGVDEVRSEFMRFDAKLVDYASATRFVHTTLLRMASLFGLKVPSLLAAEPPEATPEAYEQQVVKCSHDFRCFVHEQPTFDVETTGPLVPVIGTYARITPRASGVVGVCSKNAMHALLFCPQHQLSFAEAYVRKHREGLPPPSGEFHTLELYAVGNRVEKCRLNATVSLYAPEGKPAMPMKSDGNWIYRTVPQVMSLRSLLDSSFVMACGLESVVPREENLLRYQSESMEKAVRYFNKLYNANGEKHRLEPFRAPEDNKRRERPLVDHAEFALAALGVDIASQKTCVGDALAYLLECGVGGQLVQLLLSTITTTGLSASLDDAFGAVARCVKSNGLDAHRVSIEAFARIADANLVLQCKKRQRVKLEKVKHCIAYFSMRAGSAAIGVKNLTELPRCDRTCRKLARAVRQWQRRDEKEAEDGADDRLDMEYAMDFLRRKSCLREAIAAALNLFGSSSSGSSSAFVIAHGAGYDAGAVFEARQGELRRCTIGEVFEASSPCILLMKYLDAGGCLVTPLVYDGSAAANSCKRPKAL